MDTLYARTNAQNFSIPCLAQDRVLSFPKQVNTMPVANAAKQAELMAFKKMESYLADPEPFANPAGFDAGFPDFGFRVLIDRKSIDIHVEYKADARAQMGSVRDWIFDGRLFKVPKPNEEKDLVIEIMNKDKEAVKNAKRLLDDSKKYFDKRVTNLSVSMFNIEGDQLKRRKKAEKFANNVDNYTISKIQSNEFGRLVIHHYKTKFSKARRHDADHSLFLFMIGNSVYEGDRTGGLSNDIVGKIFKRQIPKLTGFDARLEARIQPRGLNSTGRVSMDVMANFRMMGKLSPGLLLT
jgi:hypothetical protein